MSEKQVQPTSQLKHIFVINLSHSNKTFHYFGTNHFISVIFLICCSCFKHTNILFSSITMNINILCVWLCMCCVFALKFRELTYPKKNFNAYADVYKHYLHINLYMLTLIRTTRSICRFVSFLFFSFFLFKEQRQSFTIFYESFSCVHNFFLHLPINIAFDFFFGNSVIRCASCLCVCVWTNTIIIKDQIRR